MTDKTAEETPWPRYGDARDLEQKIMSIVNGTPTVEINTDDQGTKTITTVADMIEAYAAQRIAEDRQRIMQEFTNHPYEQVFRVASKAVYPTTESPGGDDEI